MGDKMNFKQLLTKRNVLILGISLIAIIIVCISLFQISFRNKPSDELIKAVNEAWETANLEEQPDFLKILNQKSSYELKNVKKENGRFLISVTVTFPSVDERLKELNVSDYPQSKESEEINSFLCEQINKSKLKKTKATIYAAKINNEYHISFSDEFVDAMSGGLYSYSKTTLVDMLKTYTEGETE